MGGWRPKEARGGSSNRMKHGNALLTIEGLQAGYGDVQVLWNAQGLVAEVVGEVLAKRAVFEE